jgi:Reverse transcriptase (RNA-dependent DNA polymerase)
MGHVGQQNVEKLPSMCEGVDLNERHHPDSCVCEPCILSKGKRKPHDHPIEPGKHNLELIYSDMLGPMPVKGYDGSRYILTFTCDRSKLTKVYIIKTKGEIYDCFIHFKKRYERPDLGWVIKRLHDDNAREYISEKLKNYLFKNGIDLELTEVYSSQMNGPAERLGQTLYRKAAPLLKFARLNLKFWPEAVKHAEYLYIRSPHSKIKKTPFEAWHGRKPHIGHIRTFGSVAYYHNPGQKQKFRDEMLKGILVGYEGDTICRILKPNDGRIARAAAVQTVERMMWEKFDPENPVESIPDHDHFTDPTKPPVPRPYFEHVKPVRISLAPSKPFSNKKRPAEEEWFSEPVAKTRVPSVGGPVARSVSRHVPFVSVTPPVPPLPHDLPSPLPVPMPRASPPPLSPVLGIQRQPISYDQFFADIGTRRVSEPRAPTWSPLTQHPSPSPTRISLSPGPPIEPQIKVSRHNSPSIGSIPVREESLDSSSAHDAAHRPTSPNAFWEDRPPSREPRPRAAKQQHSSYNVDGSDGGIFTSEDSEEDLYDASPLPRGDDPSGPIPEHTKLFSPIPNEDTETEHGSEYQHPTVEDDDFEVIRHPELRSETPLSEPDQHTEESSDHATPPYQWLRADSDSPDPLALCLFPTYLSAFNELSLLSFLGKADPCEPFEPKTLEQAKRSHAWPSWEKAIQEEYDSLVENGTWVEQDCPSNRESLTGKWVFKIKRGAHGEILRYKARWVVRGFEQQYGLDYNETFASVVKPMSYKAIFAIAAAYDWEIEQMDVKTAFLYGEIEEDIWIELPTGCGVSGTAKLKKALYGLKQAPRVWYNTLATFLSSLGFKALDADSSVFCRDGTIIAIYVDDLLIAGASMPDINKVKDSLKQRFKMSDLGACHFYLGMEVVRNRPHRTLKLSQTAYLEKVLRDFNMANCNNKVTTPMETSSRLMPAEPGYQADPVFRKNYQSAVGSLMYAMLGTRPDLAYAVSVISRFSANPTDAHWSAVKRIFRYIASTLGMCLVYRGEIQPLEGYTDSDWAGDQDTRRSTSGYVFSLGSAAISWSSKRQPTVALSTCEAEYVGQKNAAKEAIWLQRFLKQIDPSQDPGLSATIIYGDNQGAIALAKNASYHGRTKHFDTDIHFIRECIADGRVDLRYIPTTHQVADGLTKPLCRDKFEAFRQAVGVE